MSEGEIAKDRIATRPDAGTVVDFRPPQTPATPTTTTPPQVSFNRLELGAILNVYGRMVAAGEWRDYAIDFNRDSAVFSIYRRASEMPLYRVVKTPALARKQGAYAVIASAGQVLKRGQDLARVLAIFDKPVRLVT
ncbi:MAG: DUF2794 domain-containing protein [Bosea sp. (in: a-proteobacteria)]